MEPIEEMMYISKASHLDVPKHQRPPIWTEEPAGFHKRHVEASQRVLRFRDEVNKGPAEAASIDTDQIPSIDTNTLPSIDTTTASSIDSGRLSEQKDFDVCGNLRDGDTTTRSDKSGGKKRRNWKTRKRIKGDSQLSFIPRFSYGLRKSRVRSRCFL
uniref:Uncharacterized protein n=1 Tax=Brassica oleracea var. oleracea TaxID=109376 RepID=A0A0D3E8G9_BRAOL